MGLVSLYDPESAQSRVDTRIAYVGPGEFANQLKDHTPLDVVVLGQGAALDAFDHGTVDAVIEELYDQPGGIRTVNLLMPQGELRTTLLVTLLKDQLKDYERTLRDERGGEIQTRMQVVETESGGNPYFSFTYALLVPLLLIIPVFLSGSIAADSITQEIQTKTLDLLRASPAGAQGIFLGKLLPPVVIAPLQGVLWILLLALNGIPIHNPLWILTEVTALSLVFVVGAVLFGLLLKKPGDAQVAYSLLILLAFGASYLLPQPVLATLARLAVGSLTSTELNAVLGSCLVALAAVAAGGFAVRRFLD